MAKLAMFLSVINNLAFGLRFRVPLAYSVSMLRAYRRHTEACRKALAKKGFTPAQIAAWQKCSCPFWAAGVDDRGEIHRHTLNTRDLYVAREKLQALELGKDPASAEPPITIAGAFDRARGILATQKGVKPQSLDQNQGTIQRLLEEYAQAKGFRWLKEFTAADLDALVSKWTGLSPSTRRIRLSVMKGFFELALSRKWITDDPTEVLIMPRGHAQGQTKPFGADEDAKILEAIPRWESNMAYRDRAGRSAWSAHPRTASALITVLRYAGLRISDAFAFDPRTLDRREIDGKTVYCYHAPRQKKTDHPVFLPLPPDIAEPIIAADRLSARFAFWDGATPLRAWNAMFATSCLRFLTRTSGVANIHPHRFRDTFAVDLLSRGADIRSVSRLLGHKSVATTLAYYEHWMPADQERLIRVAMEAWGH